MTEPTYWTLSYVTVDGGAIVKRVAAPKRELFHEDVIKSPVDVEMDFRECRRFSHYRFWVGPYGNDDAYRQPSEWTLSVRGDDGDLMPADREQIKEGYHNNAWYTFPLHADKGCVRHVRWEINKVVEGKRIPSLPI